LGHHGVAVRTRPLALVLFVVFTALYSWAAPSLAHQHWDSLEYGYAVDSRGWSAIWGNHPLGHVLQRAVYSAARAAGYHGHALPLLELISAAAGGAAVAMFFVLLASLRTRGAAAASAAGDLGWALVFGGAYGFWRFAGTADVYTIAAFSLVAALTAMIAAASRASISMSLVTGALAAIAALSHQFAGVLLAATAIALLPLWRRAGTSRAVTCLAAMAVAAAAVLTAGYVAIGLAALGTADPARLVDWAKGYSGDPTYGRYMTLLGLSHAIFASTETLARHTEGTIEIARRVVLGAGLLWLLAATVFMRRLPHPDRAVAVAVLVQCLVGWTLVIWWEPGLVGKFWLLLLPGFLIWCRFSLAATLHRIGARGLQTAGRALPLAAGVALLAFNWTTAMSYERRPNEVFERSLNLWIAHSHPDDVLVETGRFTAHLLFWGRRAGTANVYRLLQEGHNQGDPYAPLRALFERTRENGRQVLFAPGLSSYFTDDRLGVVGTTARDLIAFFESYRWEGPLFEYQEDDGHPVKQAFRLRGTELFSTDPRKPGTEVSPDRGLTSVPR
jgi:hypothetical protein